MIDSPTGAPANYAELYEHYFPMIRSIVAKAGIAPADIEDVAMDLLTRFMERDALSWYDPTLLHDVGKHPRLAGERKRPARFQGLLRQFCVLYVRQHLDRQNLRATREPARLEAPASSGGGSSDGTAQTWIEAHAERHCVDAVADRSSATEVVESIDFTLETLESEHHKWASRALLHKTEGNRAAATHALRRSAEASRARQALISATELAAHEVRVTAKAIADMNGWSTGTASTALKAARAALRPELVAV